MTAWLSQFFFNPTFVLGGLSLIAAPIIIHLINRFRFRRVRFAAMEFLLQSQRRNQRRVLIEQLLLLLLRILIILAIVALISRLVLDPSQLAVFRGAQTHHVVLLDDSGSMKDRTAEGNAFAAGLDVIQKMVAEGSQQPGSQRFTLIRLSNPDATFANFSQRVIDEALLIDVTEKFEALKDDCTNQRFSVVDGLQAAQRLFADDQSAIKHLHVVSDFRAGDWLVQESLASMLNSLDQSGINVNLIKTVKEQHDNLSVVGLRTSSTTAAVGIPMRMFATIANLGGKAIDELAVRVAVDDQQLPYQVRFEDLEPGRTGEEFFDVVFDAPGIHQVSVSLADDPLTQDNVRYTAVPVNATYPVLIIDGTPGFEEAQYVADAIGSESTGYSTTIEDLKYLQTRPLDQFMLIYLLNVPELPPDARAALENYVENGGGLAWFLGDQVLPSSYNENLHQDGTGLFPVPLGVATETLSHNPELDTGADLLLTDHPIFRVLNAQDGLLSYYIDIFRYQPTSEEWLAEDMERADRVTTIARLRNRDPFMFEHAFGDGRVITCLTSVGPVNPAPEERWNNWPNDANAISFPVFHLSLCEYLMRTDLKIPDHLVGQPINLELSAGQYQREVELELPAEAGGLVRQLEASVVEVPAKQDSSETETTDTSEEGSPEAEAAPEDVQLVVNYDQTDAPGIYQLKLFPQTGDVEERLLAYNVPAEESDLTLATTRELRQRLGPGSNVQIQEPGQLNWIEGQEAGHEIRMLLLAALVILLLGEQALAYRLSYHGS